MIPPKFSDLGKSIRDLLKKDYHHPLQKVEVSTLTKEGILFKANIFNGTQADLEATFPYRPLNAIITENWSTKNILTQTISLVDPLFQGVKIDIDSTYAPNTGALAAILSTSFARQNYNCNAITDFARSTITTSAVLNFERILLGGQSIFNYGKGKVDGYSVALGYIGHDMAFHAATNLRDILNLSAIRKISGDVTAAVSVDISMDAEGSVASQFQVGGKFSLENGAVLKAKIDNKAALAVSYTQSISKNASIGLSMLIDTTKLGSDAHQVGFNVALSA
jgi:voltage-dependent anion channel protein 2